MYHQFKELADLDITKEPMEVGPTTHYIMGGIRVDADTQESTVPGLFAAGECAAGINGANRLGGNSLSDLLVFGQRAGEHGARFARASGAARVDERQVERAMAASLAPFERGGAGDNPYQVQADLQDAMQSLVGIVRTEGEMQEALGRLAASERAGGARGRGRAPRVQCRLARVPRSPEPARRVGGDHALGDRAQGEPWRALPRGLPGEARRVRHLQRRRCAAGRRLDAGVTRAAAADAGGVEAGARGARALT